MGNSPHLLPPAATCPSAQPHPAWWPSRSTQRFLLRWHRGSWRTGSFYRHPPLVLGSPWGWCGPGCGWMYWVSVSNMHCTKQQIPWVIKWNVVLYGPHTSIYGSWRAQSLPLGSRFFSDRGHVSGETPWRNSPGYSPWGSWRQWLLAWKSLLGSQSMAMIHPQRKAGRP